MKVKNRFGNLSNNYIYLNFKTNERIYGIHGIAATKVYSMRHILVGIMLHQKVMRTHKLEPNLDITKDLL
jgi:hypothetical protein